MKALMLRARWLLSALLVVGAFLFAIGVAAERDSEDEHHDEPAAAHVEEGEGTEHDEAGEPAQEPASDEHDEEAETVLGINVESTPLVVIGVVISIALAIAVWFRPDRWLL